MAWRVRYACPLGAPLSDRQRDVMLKIVDEGKRPCEIAKATGMAPATIQNHLHRAMAKLGARTPEQAAVFFDRQRRRQCDNAELSAPSSPSPAGCSSS